MTPSMTVYLPAPSGPLLLLLLLTVPGASAAAPGVHAPSLVLKLADGSRFTGSSFGFEHEGHASGSGEVVFSTAMVGMPESLTDPSYSGQILVLTYPLQGNYGVPGCDEQRRGRAGPPRHLESYRIHVAGLVVSEYSGESVFHWEANCTLANWLKQWKIPAIEGVDTRALTLKLRGGGTLRGSIAGGGSAEDTSSDAPPSALSLAEHNVVAAVSGLGGDGGTGFHYYEPPPAISADDNAAHVVDFEPLLSRETGTQTAGGAAGAHVLLVDCGAKLSILRTLLAHGLRVTVVPWDADVNEHLRERGAHGVVVSNGPGDPTWAAATVAALRDFMAAQTQLGGGGGGGGGGATPLLAICLGHQLLALAAGASTFKMPFGNRGHNHPVQDLSTGRAFMTSQNHGFAVNESTLPAAAWVPAYRNLNDGTNEGIVHRTHPWLGVQFHPEAKGGPTDTRFLIRDFARLATAHAHRGRPGGGATTTQWAQQQLQHRPGADSALGQKTLKKDDEAVASKMKEQRHHQEQRKFRVLILGSGGISIGQAGEFDYAGTQALKALRDLEPAGTSEERIDNRFAGGVHTILVNPNVASSQTTEGVFLRREPYRARDHDQTTATTTTTTRDTTTALPSKGKDGRRVLADEIFSLPVTPDAVERLVAQTRPDGILLSFGGQTALNCGVELDRRGVLRRYNVTVLGTPISSIVQTEDRAVFKARLLEIGERVAPSESVASAAAAVDAARRIGFPILVRAGFALGGQGSGVARSNEELRELVIAAQAGSDSSSPPPILLDRYLAGWREVEYEVIRDAEGNAFCVCNMENFDPLGVHTGESIVVAPSQTLSDAEYFALRAAALRIASAFGIVGECNVQFALHPTDSTYLVVEVNPRLSRSSALASKATGYPIAAVAARLGMGMTLPGLRNAVTGGRTSAFHEPALDYVVVKVPRWDSAKFDGVHHRIGTQMKSIGEAMGVARSFMEALQKALRMAGGSSLLGSAATPARLEVHEETDTQAATAAAAAEVAQATEGRVFRLASFLYDRILSEARAHDATGIDRWFLRQMSACFEAHRMLAGLLRKHYGARSLAEVHDEYGKEGGAAGLRVSSSLLVLVQRAKRCGYTDADIARIASPNTGADDVRAYRLAHGVVPFFKQIDSVAGEFPASTNYLYASYSGGSSDDTDDEHEKAAGKARTTTTTAATATNTTSVLVIGSGVYRIGSSVEFDSLSMTSTRTLRARGHRAVMMNCNPETVSTDWDESDVLYLEELSLERILDVVERERRWSDRRGASSFLGAVVSMGGQTPNNLAVPLHEHGVPILGTHPRSIARAENRAEHSAMLQSLGLAQPEWTAAQSPADAAAFARRVGYPVLVRPSFVLSGTAMRVSMTEADLKAHLTRAAEASPEHPVVVSKYIEDAREIDIDAVAANGQLVLFAISDHLERGGVHSGDATMIFPSSRSPPRVKRRLRDLAARVAAELHISGPFNVQALWHLNSDDNNNDDGDDDIDNNSSKDGDPETDVTLRVIETNLRASRSVPFVSKVLGIDFAAAATDAILRTGASATSSTSMTSTTGTTSTTSTHSSSVHARCDAAHEFWPVVGIKVAMFSFPRLPGSDPLLGAEMKSTGEVAAFGALTVEEAKGASTEAARAALEDLTLSVFLQSTVAAAPAFGEMAKSLGVDPISFCALRRASSASSLSVTVTATGGQSEDEDEAAFLGLGLILSDWEGGSEQPGSLLVSSSALQERAQVLLSLMHALNVQPVPLSCRTSLSLVAAGWKSPFRDAPCASNATETVETLRRLSGNRNDISAHDELVPERGRVKLVGAADICLSSSACLHREMTGNGFQLRRTAVDLGVPLVTDVDQLEMLLKALGRAAREPSSTRRPLQSMRDIIGAGDHQHRSNAGKTNAGKK